MRVQGSWLKEFLEAVRFGLVHQRVAVGDEQDLLRWLARINTSINDMVVRVLPVPVAMTIKALRFPLGEGLAHPADRFVLIDPVGNLGVDGDRGLAVSGCSL